MAPWSRSTPCDRAREWISVALDDELNGLEAAALARHLSRCAGCAGLAAELGRSTALLRAVPPEPMRLPVVLPARVRARAPRLRRTAVGVASFAAAVASVAVLGLETPFTLSQRQPLGPDLGIPHPRALESAPPAAQLRAAPAPVGLSPFFLVRARA